MRVRCEVSAGSLWRALVRGRAEIQSNTVRASRALLERQSTERQSCQARFQSRLCQGCSQRGANAPLRAEKGLAQGDAEKSKSASSEHLALAHSAHLGPLIRSVVALSKWRVFCSEPPDFYATNSFVVLTLIRLTARTPPYPRLPGPRWLWLIDCCCFKSWRACRPDDCSDAIATGARHFTAPLFGPELVKWRSGGPPPAPAPTCTCVGCASMGATACAACVCVQR